MVWVRAVSHNLNPMIGQINGCQGANTLSTNTDGSNFETAGRIDDDDEQCQDARARLKSSGSK